MRQILLSPLLSALGLLIPALSIQAAPTFVTYGGHPATYGDHTVGSATWSGVAGVTVTFDADPAILHGDGNGSSQRTARNGLTYQAPQEGVFAQYDNPAVSSLYGSSLPLLQHMAANGTATLSYTFDQAIFGGIDLFITDVDTDDFVTVTAYGAGGVPLDMQLWSEVGDGDLSLYAGVGGGGGPLSTPPDVLFSSGAITLDALVGINENRSYTILRSAAAQGIESIDITFTGLYNSPSRTSPDGGSHIYVGLSTAVPEPGAMSLALFGGLWLSLRRCRSPLPSRWSSKPGCVS